MNDEIDYSELFGVGDPEDHRDGRSAEPNDVPLGDQEQGDGQTQSPAQENVSDSDTAEAGEAGAAASDSDTSAQDQEAGQGQAPGTVSDSDTPGQKPEAGRGQPPDAVSDSGAGGPGQLPSEAAAKQQVEDAQKAVDAVFARSGMKNPYTGQPITTKAEYDAYRERFEQERRDQLLRQSGMSQEEFQRFVQDLPEVRRAREAQEAAERTIREAREAAARVKLEEQLREIGAMDPSIKSVADLAKMPTYPRFYELVQRGNTFTDAFRLANFDALAQRSAAGARQAAVNSARSKEHLSETRTRGTGAVSVPAEVREQYKLLTPDATEEEIQKHYQKYHKGG